MQEELRHLHDEQDTNDKLNKALRALEKEERDNFAGHMPGNVVLVYAPADPSDD